VPWPPPALSYSDSQLLCCCSVESHVASLECFRDQSAMTPPNRVATRLMARRPE